MDSDPSSPQSSIPSQSQNNNTDTDVVAVFNGGGDVSDDNDGFLSGQEDFETESDSPLQLPNTDDGAEDDDDDAAPSEDFFTPMVEKPSLEGSVEIAGDDNEVVFSGASKGGVLKGLRLELDGEVAVEESGDGMEEFVEAYGVGDDDDKGDFDGVENNGVNGYGLEKDEDFVIEENHEVSGEGDDCLVNNNNNLTSGTKDSGDSLVEALQVDLLASGVADVGDKEEVEESKIKGLDGGVGGPVSLENEFDPIELETVEAFDKLVNGDVEFYQNVDAGADVNGAGQAEKEHESEIEVVKNFGNLEFASDYAKVVQNDRNIEAHDGEGEAGSHVEDIVGFVTPNSFSGIAVVPDEVEDDIHNWVLHGLESEDEGEKMVFENSEVAKLFLEELEKQSGVGSAGLGPSPQSSRPSTGLNHANLFTSYNSRASANSDINLTDEEKKKLEKLQQLSIKFLRLVHRMGFTTKESLIAHVLNRLTLIAGRRQTSQIFSIDAAKESAWQLEAEGKDDFDCSLNILVLGKTGVGKGATINSILGETKASVSAYGSGTTSVTEIIGMVHGFKMRFFDTPGLKSSALEQSFNRKVLSMVMKSIKRSPPDIVLYVDRLDTQTKDLNDLSLIRSISSSLGPSIWQNAIVALTHGASAPPDGSSGSPLSYDVYVAQRTHIVQQTISQAIGNMHLVNPVTLVENHPSCLKNRNGEKVLPNGQTWRPSLLLQCHSMKVLAEAGKLWKVQESFDLRKVFGIRPPAAPLPYLLSWLLQSRSHPTLAADQGGIDNGDSFELADLSDSDLDEDEYDQLPPFKPLTKSQIANLSREQRKAYFEEYDYRVKLMQKMWRKELKRTRDIKKKGKPDVNEYGYMEEDQENGDPVSVPVPLLDMALPSSFDSDNPAYRYRFLEPTSQLLMRPVLDTHCWDHDCGYNGINIENTLAIINKFPAAIAVQMSKDKKDFTIHLDSSIAAKHGDNGSSMAGFDIQNIGKQLAYILRGETKFKNFKRNRTAAGFSVTFLGENISTGLKLENQLAVRKRLILVGSTGVVQSQGDSSYGSNVEVQLRDAHFPVGQDQYTLGLSLVSLRGDLALGANFQSLISIGRSYKMSVRAGLNNKLSGQISVRMSSSDQLQIALLAIFPIARAIYKNLWPKASENYPSYY